MLRTYPARGGKGREKPDVRGSLGRENRQPLGPCLRFS